MSTDLIANTANIATTVDPIFVVGAPRSGTTLVARILGRHPDILALAPAETNFFEDIWTRRENLGDLSDDTILADVTDRVYTLFSRYNLPEAQAYVDANLRREDLAEWTRRMGGGYDSLYRAFIDLMAEAAGKRFFCDDTPKHLFFVRTILDSFPTAKVIGCVRDPRDFLCSYKNLWKRSTEGDRIKQLYHPILTTLLWRSSANQLSEYIEEQYLQRVAVVRYESLVEDPAGEALRLCRLLDIDYDDNLVQVDSNNSSFGDSVGSGIFHTSVGRWKTQLDPEELWCAQTFAGKAAKTFGYDPAPAAFSWYRLAGIMASTPIHALRALYANRAKRGPLAQYIVRRVRLLMKG